MGENWLHIAAIWDTILSKFRWTNDEGSPYWDFPNRSGNVALVNNADNHINHVDHFEGVLAELATHVRAGEDLSAALPITFTIDLQPDVPRTLTYDFVAHAQITAFTLVFTGVDAQGNVVTDTFVIADGWSGETANAYATITSIILTTRTGTGAGDTMNIGIGSELGLSNKIAATTDVYKVVKSTLAAGLAADYSDAGSITVEATYSVVNVSVGAAIVDGDKFTIFYKA